MTDIRRASGAKGHHKDCGGNRLEVPMGQGDGCRQLLADTLGWRSGAEGHGVEMLVEGGVAGIGNDHGSEWLFPERSRSRDQRPGGWQHPLCES